MTELFERTPQLGLKDDRNGNQEGWPGAGENPVEGIEIEHRGEDVDHRQKDDSATDQRSCARPLGDTEQPVNQ